MDWCCEEVVVALLQGGGRELQIRGGMLLRLLLLLPLLVVWLLLLLVVPTAVLSAVLAPAVEVTAGLTSLLAPSPKGFSRQLYHFARCGCCLQP